MNRPAILIAAALAVALIPVTASAATSHPQPHIIRHGDNLTYGDYRFFVEHKAPPVLPQIVFAFNITTNSYPRDYHLTMEMFRWPPIGPEADVYGRELKNITDLPDPGSSAIWRMARKCRTGRYYEELTTTGVSSTGHYQRDSLFFPAGRRKVKANNLLGWKWVPDASRAPDRKHSHQVKEC